MQLRRVLLLFALVLGLSAVVSSVVPPPEPREGERSTPLPTPRLPADIATPRARTIRISVPPRNERREEPENSTAALGSRLALEVSVPEPGDVVIEGLGLRESADRYDPARFDLLADPPGRYDVSFVPVGGDPRVAARLEFERPSTVTRPRRDR